MKVKGLKKTGDTTWLYMGKYIIERNVVGKYYYTEALGLSWAYSSKIVEICDLIIRTLSKKGDHRLSCCVVHTRNGKNLKSYVNREEYCSLFETYKRDCKKVTKGHKVLFFDHDGQQVASFFIEYKKG